MFEFLAMAGNYESRKVARNDYLWGFVSTASVNDGNKPFETAVEHSGYGDGIMVIVENYDTREEAKDGHQRWVATMTGDCLPECLTDCNNSESQQMCSEFGGSNDKKLN